MKIKVKNSGIVRLETHRNQFHGDLFVAETDKPAGRQADSKNSALTATGASGSFSANSVFNEIKNIPFKIKRVYFINNFKKPGRVRGEHAHKKLRQVIFCANGSFILTLDDGQKKQQITMKDSSVGVIINTKLWHTMTDFSENCVILVLADDWYRESDYIRKYKVFLAYIKKNG